MLSSLPGLNRFPSVDFSKMINATNFDRPMELVNIVKGLTNKLCDPSKSNVFCMLSISDDGQFLAKTASGAAQAGITQASSVQAPKVAYIKATTADLSYNMIVSGITIFVIVLVMVIIYLILRYRKKKKMKKKLQYIKLLKE
ncbi:hypothetical protein PFNF135_04233 [Plasmodium falciparum NF135/5.C10]|uniref:Surface antigen n=1 Tax=Plasmodium falciparum NF135/5.C10 TaxID=1036726 RepID=W4IE13_PLAFA|nr:hypothetical protein PFNF135_04233 [Plasmodium falciparum NF135/5.C10]